MTSPSDAELVALPARRDKPVTQLHRLEYALVVSLMALFRLIGVDAASWLAGKFARHVGPLIRPVSRKAERNLALIYPHWDKQTIRAVTRDVWENTGRTAGEFPHLEYLRDFEENGRIEMVGKDRLDAMIASPTPFIIITSHFANWELTPSIAHHAGFDYGFVYRPANNPLTDELIINHRGKVMSRHQVPKGNRGARMLVDMLQHGRSLGMLVDQKLNTGISVPFMGVPAMTAPATARLSLKFNAPVVQISLLRKKGAHFTFTVHEPLDFAPSGETDADVLALTKLINEAYERDIRANPGQWLWFHRRWPKETY